MDKVALEIRSDKMEVALKAVMDLAESLKFEAKILQNSTTDKIENFDEISKVVLSKLDKPANKAVFERLKYK